MPDESDNNVITVLEDGRTFVNQISKFQDFGDSLKWSDEYCKIIGHIMKESQKPEIKEPIKLVNGNEIMKMFSIPPGPQIGVLLKTIQEAQAIGNINSKQQALNLIEANLNSSGGSGA